MTKKVANEELVAQYKKYKHQNEIYRANEKSAQTPAPQ